ncbi:MAG: FkbM family methyltransferase [Kordiimonadaceae bacterium]|nr:FkbM family methyltransferase [Kordiimonadaceae bacterium]
MHLVTLEFFREILGQEMPVINLMDIGASGGIDNSWKVFEPKFNALGVEPLETEVDRLNQAEENPSINYYSAFAVYKQWDELYPASDRPLPSEDPFYRSSAAVAGESKENFIQNEYNAGAPISYTKVHKEIDELVDLMPGKSVDFLKTDTDGFDFPAILGAKDLMTKGMLLGAKIEASLHGPAHQYANTFANIDTYMRGNGFTLLNLETYNYTRSVFPGRFMYTLPAQTRKGAILWGDAYYYRDFCCPKFEQEAGWLPTKEQLIKMVLLLEYLGCHDSMVELLIGKADLIGISDQLPSLLDRIVKRYTDPKLGTSYEELISNFRADYKSFYPE